MEVVKTTHKDHAKTLASTVDINRCPDGTDALLYDELSECGLLLVLLNYFPYLQSLHPEHVYHLFSFPGIICVGGDGIINEVSCLLL